MLSALVKRTCCSIKNRKLAYAILALYSLVYGTNTSLLPAMVTNLEKRFDLSAAQVSYLLSANDIGYLLCVLFVAYYGGRDNHVKCLAYSAVGVALSGLLMALPYFIFGNRYPPDEMLGLSNSSLASALRVGKSMTLTAACRPKPSASPQIESVAEVDIGTQRAVAMALQMVGGIVVGVAATPFWNVGISFLDDIMGCKSGIYIGCLYAIRCVAPIIGFALASFMNTVNESLRFLASSYPGGQKDPFWINAWWIGFVIVGGIMLLTFPCLHLFDAKDMTRQASEEEQRRRKRKAVGRTGEEEAKEMLEMKEGEKKEKTKVLSDLSIKDMLKVQASFWRNPIFLTLILGKLLEMCGHIGIFTFFPKFVEFHFRMTASEANMTTAFVLGGSAIVATALSGLISKRWKMTPKKSNLFHAVTNLASACMFPFLLLFVCPTVPILGSGNTSPDFGCAQHNCSCPFTYKPVCVDGQNYFSACQAGCESFDALTSTYSNCLCKNATAVPGVCGGKCELVYYYGIFLFVVRIAGIIAAVQHTQFIMSLSSKKEDKAMGLANVSACYGLMGMILPVVTGKIIASMCLLRNPSVSGKSFCVLYDVDKMRVILHLVSFFPQLLACGFYFISWYLTPRDMKAPENEDEKRKEPDGTTALALSTGSINKLQM